MSSSQNGDGIRKRCCSSRARQNFTSTADNLDLFILGGLSDRVGLGPCLLKIPIVLRGRLALVSLCSPGEVSALFVHDYWSRQ